MHSGSLRAQGAANCIKTWSCRKVGLNHESTHATATASCWAVGDDPLRAGQQRSNHPALRHLHRGDRFTSSGCSNRWPAAAHRVEALGPLRRTGSVKWRRSRSRRDAVGALDRFRETATVSTAGLGECTSPRTRRCHLSEAHGATGGDAATVLGVLVVEDSGACGSLVLVAGRRGRSPRVTGSGTLARGGDGRAAKPQARAARPQSRPQSRVAPGEHCLSHVGNRVPLMPSRKSLQLGISGHSASRRSACRKWGESDALRVCTAVFCCPLFPDPADRFQSIRIRRIGQYSEVISEK
jgi:hypothetical protein